MEGNPQTARGMETYIRTPFAILQQTGAGEAGNLILLDPLGSAVRTLDREGNTLEAMAYDPYGKEMAYMQTTAGALYHSPFGYGGYYRTERKHVYQTENRVYNGNTGRFESKDIELFVHPYVPESTNLYQYAWNSPLRYTDPTGRDVEESEWDRYMELGLTDFVKYHHNQMVDRTADEIMLIRGYKKLDVFMAATAQAIMKDDIKNLNHYTLNLSINDAHGDVDAIWDATLGRIESEVESYFNERLEMENYVRDTFSGKNDEPWFVQARKLGAIGMQYTTGAPAYSMVRMQEDTNRMLVDIAYTVTQMDTQDWITLGIAPARLAYDSGKYIQDSFQSEEQLGELFYHAGYMKGTIKVAVIEELVLDVLALKLFSRGGRAVGKQSKINLRGVEVLDDVTDTSRIADRTTDVIEGGTSTFKYKEIKTFTADETNQWFIDNVKPDYKPPYKPGTIVKEIELTENTTFVRVYDNTPDGSGMYGSWLMKAEDIEGLTPLEIQNKFALPNTPKYVCDVELEAGTHIRVGEVNPLEGWGSGGGTQYDLIGQRIGDFKNERLLEGN